MRARAATIARAAVLVSALLAAGAARAQEDEAAPETVAVSAEDRATLASCLRDAADLPRACIGAIAVVCARAPGASADAGIEVACSRREAGVWRERLDLVGGALAARLESGPRSRLAAAQRAFEDYAVQKCAFAAEMQAPARASAMEAACALREVAGRAIEMERLASGSRSGRRPGGPSGGRPMIQR